MISKLRRNEVWAISVQLLVLYVVSVGLFFGIHEVWRKLSDPQKDKIAGGARGPAVFVLLLAFALNFAGTAAFAKLAHKLGEAPRLAMIVVLLVLILEKHVRRLRGAPQERRFQLIGVAGVSAGILSAMYVFMRHAPLK